MIRPMNSVVVGFPAHRVVAPPLRAPLVVHVTLFHSRATVDVPSASTSPPRGGCCAAGLNAAGASLGAHHDTHHQQGNPSTAPRALAHPSSSRRSARLSLADVGPAALPIARAVASAAAGSWLIRTATQATVLAHVVLLTCSFLWASSWPHSPPSAYVGRYRFCLFASPP